MVRKDDDVVYGDSGYLGVANQEEIKKDEELSRIEFRINKRPSSLKTKVKKRGKDWDRMIERRKSAIRSKVEHVFLIMKREFGYAKVAYRGLAKNLNRIYMLLASANLLMCKRAKRTLAPIIG